jgi:hypothetical protein
MEKNLQSLQKGVGSVVGSGSGVDPELHQNVTDPQHWLEDNNTVKKSWKNQNVLFWKHSLGRTFPTEVGAKDSVVWCAASQPIQTRSD